MNKLTYCIFIVLILIPYSYKAESEAKNETNLIEFATSSEWLNILFYKKTEKGKFESQLNNNFLLSKNGKTNPYDEIKTELKTLKNKYTSAKMQCKFPRRTKFIIDKLNLNITKKPCYKLQNWLNQFETSKLKIFITSGKINKPQSMFGHIFMAVPSKNKKTLLSYKTISYIANTSEKYNKYGTTIDGLFGNYPNKILIDDFYKILKEYSEKDSRGIWEYNLNLTTKEIKNILLLIWEVKDKAFNYFFTNKNCSSQSMAIITHEYKNDHFNFFYTPMDLISYLTKIKKASFVRYWPSKDEEITSLYKNDNNVQEDYLLKSELTSKKITDSSINYDKGMNFFWQTLKKRKIIIKKNTIEKDDIYKRHKPQSLSLSYKYLGKKNWIGLGYRLGYHDLLSPLGSYNKGVTTTLLDIKTIISNKIIKLQNITYLDIKNLHNYTDISPQFSWTINAQTNYQVLKAEKEYVSSISFKYGAGLEYHNFLINLVNGPIIKYSYKTYNKSFLGYVISTIITKQNKHFAYNLTINKEIGISKNYLKINKYEFSTSFSKNKNYSLIFKLAQNQYDTTASIGLRTYF